LCVGVKQRLRRSRRLERKKPAAQTALKSNFADKWQLDEMVVTIKGKKYWLWRAVDANGYVLDALLRRSVEGLPVMGSLASSAPVFAAAHESSRARLCRPL
jgi:hypothetical protein